MLPVELRPGSLTPPVTLPASATPDPGLVPAAVMARYISHSNLDGSIVADGVSQFSTLWSQATGAQSATNGVQPVAVYGLASNSGSQAPNGAVRPDAVGVYGFATINNGGTGSAIAGFFAGRREATAGGADAPITAIQVTAINQGAASSYSATSVTDTCIFAGNNSSTQIGSGLLIGGPNPIDVGIGFTGGSIAAVQSASIRDDSSSATSIILNGTHSGYGIDLRGGTFTNGAIRLPNNVSIVARNAANSADVSLLKYDSSNFMEVGAIAYFTTTAIFTSSIQLNDAVEVLLGTGTGTQIGTAVGQKLGFWGATPVVQQTSSGNTHTVTAGSTTSVFTNTTFDGSTGATAYTIGDIVKALKTIGVLQT